MWDRWEKGDFCLRHQLFINPFRQKRHFALASIYHSTLELYSTKLVLLRMVGTCIRNELGDCIVLR